MTQSPAGLYEEKLANLTFSVSHLFLLSRPDKTGPVEQMRVRLGPAGEEGTGLQLGAKAKEMLRQVTAKAKAKALHGISSRLRCSTKAS